MKIKPGRETITFNGIEFYRYPKAKNWAERSYFRPRVLDIAKGIEALHREIWKFHNGPIPKDCEIHHKDLDPNNNDISNLECLTKAEHQKRHTTHRSYPQPWRRRALNLAAAWHRSLAGHVWHVQHGHNVTKNRKRISKICKYCGDSFKCWNTGHSIFCSNKCKSAWRRHAHLDDIEYTCEYCGKPFRANKYDARRFCSISCAMSVNNKLRHH